MTEPGAESRKRSVSPLGLVAYLDEYLDSASFQDYGPNGLQVDGRSEIRHLVTGVSACSELFSRAGDLGADSVLVHHGLFWNSQPANLTGVQYERVASLMRAGISLIAYHLPLDAHAEVGNNAVAARLLGLECLCPFGTARGTTIGYRGRFPAPVSADELAVGCSTVFGQEPVLLGRPDDSGISTVAVVSGGGQDFLYQAIDAGVDAFVTGEASEWVTNLSREAGICYVVAGHYATERLGVRALGDHLAERFGILVDFEDVPNPV